MCGSTFIAFFGRGPAVASPNLAGLFWLSTLVHPGTPDLRRLSAVLWLSQNKFSLSVRTWRIARRSFTEEEEVVVQLYPLFVLYVPVPFRNCIPAPCVCLCTMRVSADLVSCRLFSEGLVCRITPFVSEGVLKEL